jgi:hypothetical protein
MNMERSDLLSGRRAAGGPNFQIVYVVTRMDRG